jgi:hypothetical protein
LTFGPFSGGIATGLISKRRLSPIVDWETAGKIINA